MDHAKFLTRCLQLASYGRGRTNLNPSVGAVVVCDGKIIGEGYHHQYGGPHAEVLAIRAVQNPELLRRSTLYCTLEPCAHHGKTPPCCELITAHGIPHVVIGCTDPHEKVDGKGIAHMKAHGVKVELSEQPERFIQAHKSFWTNFSLARPMITLKWAQSKDGFVDAQRADDTSPAALSGPLAAIASHRLRARVDGILISSKTLAVDRPSLSTRNWSGTSPRPILLQSERYPLTQALTSCLHSPPLVVAKEPIDGFETILCDPKDVKKFLPQLLDRGIGHLLVEGGAQILQSFIDLELYDEVWNYKSTVKELVKGVAAPQLPENDHCTGRTIITEEDDWYVRG